MNLNFIDENNRIYIKDDQNNFVGEITFIHTDDDAVIIDHTLVDPNYRGQGIAEQLAIKAIERAKKENKKIIPQCSYIVKYFNEHPELESITYKG